MSENLDPSHQPAPIARGDEALIARYWRRNVALMAGLLAVWALVSLGAGVLFADALNAYRIGGFPLGFWFAQQGSIIAFVVLVLIYALAMSRLDRRHHEELDTAHARVDSPR